MIKFVAKYPNFENTYTITLYFKKILVGGSSACHLKINDKTIPNKALLIINDKDGCLAEGLNETIFQVNQKKIVGTKMLYKGDTINLGETSLRIEDIDPSKAFEDLNREKKYEDFYRTYEEYESILNALEKEVYLSS